MSDIVLIGFMGAGKTTVGQALARRLGLPFIDTDQRIVARAGMAITDIFDTQGEAAFRKLETEILLELAADTQAAVVSTGGGMPVYAPNRPLLRQLGTVVYLEVTPQTVWTRLAGDTSRPLLQGASAEERVKELLAFRGPIYAETAHVTVDAAQHCKAIVEELAAVYANDQGTIV